MEIEFKRTKKNDTKKKALQHPFCQNTFSGKENLPAAFKKVSHWKYSVKNATQESQKIQTLSIRIDDVLHPFYNGRFRGNNVLEDKMGKKLL